MRESCVNSLVMIQPALMEYSLQSIVPSNRGMGQVDEHGQLVEEHDGRCEPSPVLLDSTSMKKDVVLLMDSFFYVVIWKGATVQSWVDQNFHLQEEYAHIKTLIEQPALDAKDILTERFPTPKFIQTSDGGSQARFLLCRVNPSRTHSSGDNGGGGGQAGASSIVLTEDASLTVFMQTLIRYAVSS